MWPLVLHKVGWLWLYAEFGRDIPICVILHFKLQVWVH